MHCTLIGVDCATDPKNVGLALGRLSGDPAVVERVRVGARTAQPAEIIAAWVQAEASPTLLALDAPLGWPQPLGNMLRNHQAGEAPTDTAHHLFRRTTDRFIREHLGRQPLDVGADRIARTAYAALKLLNEVRRRTGREIPLAWSPAVTGTSAIEVYPAGTLTAHGILSKRYKRPQDREARLQILDALGQHVQLPVERLLLEGNADALDAVVCLLAAQDFLRGQALPPLDPSLAEQEGWIWVRQPEA